MKKRPTAKEMTELSNRLAKAEPKAQKWDQLMELLTVGLHSEMTAIAEDAASAAVDDLSISR